MNRGLLGIVLLLGSVITILPISPVFGQVSGVFPLINCYEVLSSVELLVYWGYSNTNAVPELINPGAGNFFSPPPANRGQPSFFYAGQHNSVFSVSTPTSQTLTWTLLGISAVFDPSTLSSYSECGTVKTVTVMVTTMLECSGRGNFRDAPRAMIVDDLLPLGACLVLCFGFGFSNFSRRRQKTEK
jgi:hypothetical protein